MKILCKLFNHKFEYYKHIDYSPAKLFRVCKRCHQLQDYRPNVPYYGRGWFSLVQYNSKNKELVNKLEKGEIK